MALSSAGNTYFSDVASVSIDIPNIRLLGLIVHCTHASNAAAVILGDNISGRSYPVIVDIEVPAASDYAHLDFSNSPLVFPNGIRIKTLSDAKITLIVGKNNDSSR